MNLRKKPFSVFIIVITLFVLFGFTLFKYSYSPDESKEPIDVIHYTINLEILDFSAKQIKGITDIQIISKTDSLKEVELDLLALEVDSVWIDDESVKKYLYDGKKLRIKTVSPFMEELTFVVTVFYHGKPKKDSFWGGFYFTKNEAYNMGVGMNSFPHPFGRVWFPCIDSYSDKATYDYFITVKEKYDVVCSGSLIEVFDNKNGTNTYHWYIKSPIPTYLSSVNIGDFAILESTYSGVKEEIPVLICVNPKDTIDALKSLSKLTEYLQTFESIFGPYQWERVGFTAVSFKGGAMEHATNIAIPSITLDGTLKYESLFTHELAHSWFGNLVTCSTSKDMWLNEGWASYCEAIYEEFAYGKEAYKNFIRSNHKEVLRVAHVRDKGYYPLYDLPDKKTYGTTIYMKGTDAVHTLRAYMGDELFFNALKGYFKKFAYSNISVHEFRDFLAKYSHKKMDNFFDNWIFTAGFPHFSIDSFRFKNTEFDKQVEVFVRQKLKGRKIFSHSNKVEITFMDQYWNKQTEEINISEEYSCESFHVFINPVCVFLDLEEKISDATIDNYRIIREKGEYRFHQTYFTADVLEITDSAFIRVVHNWVAPDDFKQPVKGLFISKARYWKIDGLFPEKFYAKGVFYYNGSKTSSNGWLDHTLISNYTDSLVLLYRPDTKNDWNITSFKKAGNNTSGLLIADTLKRGEYAMAIWDWKRYKKLK